MRESLWKAGDLFVGEMVEIFEWNLRRVSFQSIRVTSFIHKPQITWLELQVIELWQLFMTASEIKLNWKLFQLKSI